MEIEAANMEMDIAPEIKAGLQEEAGATRDDSQPQVLPVAEPSAPNDVQMQNSDLVEQKEADVNQEPASVGAEDGAQPHAEDAVVAGSDPIEQNKAGENDSADPVDGSKRSTRKRGKTDAQAKPPEPEVRQTRRRTRQEVKPPPSREEERKDVPADGELKEPESEGEGDDDQPLKKRNRFGGKGEEEPSGEDRAQEGQQPKSSARQLPAKRQRKPAAAAASASGKEGGQVVGSLKTAEVKKTSYPEPGSPEYASLSKAEKEEALMAAIEENDKAFEALKSSSLHLGAHIAAWFTHPFGAAQDAKLVKTIKRCSEKRDASVVIKNSSKAAELWNLWKKLHSLDPATTAALRERHGERPLTAHDLASFYGAVPGATGGGPGGGGAATKPPPAPPPTINASQPPPPPSSSAPQEEAQAQVQAPPPPPPAPAPASAPAPQPPSSSTAPHQIPLASFCSTGDPSRDKTVAAIFQALFSATCGPSHLLEVAVATEKRLFESTTEVQGTSSASYIRKAFLLWSLIAPDSEHMDEEVRRQLMQGQAPDVLLAGFAS